MNRLNHLPRCHSQTLMFLLVFCSGLLASGAHAQCTTEARTIAPTTVYASAPTFTSGEGWRMGKAIEKLPADTPVRICKSTSVGLFFDKKQWYRIEFDGRRAGWVFADLIEPAAESRSPAPTIRFSLLAPAFAQDSPAESPEAGADIASQGVPGFNITILLLGAFVSIVLGMVGKVAYDEVEHGQHLSLRGCVNIRKCIKALIVAPMTFSAFLVAGDYTFQDEVAVIIFLCMAFQNGFFWQTVLPVGREVPRGS